MTHKGNKAKATVKYKDKLILDVQHISKSYAQNKIFRNLNWTVERGQFWGIIGPNGCGKTTLLHLISGVEKLDEGQILLEGQSVHKYSRKSLAQKLAVLKQDGIPPMSYTVREVIEMGRFPFQSWLGKEKQQQKNDVVEEILHLLDLKELASVPLHLLSGGQRQRVALGKVMAQEPKLVLLDEPTTFLDLRYQMQFMELVAKWQQEQGLTVIAVMHDLNLASLFCNQLLLLSQGEIYAQGTPAEVLSPEVVQSIFDVSSLVAIHPKYQLPQIMLNRKQGKD
ncbi:ABC transporter ATP-binding protein [Paenibacillus turicensis]|uniref:ABC transporter ATP-binding protein n=1 Tax=Paenibacillus turicensis TaxID=160487 RepID=UPI003D2B674E